MAGCLHLPHLHGFHLHSIKLRRRTRSLELEDLVLGDTNGTSSPPNVGSPKLGGSPQIPNKKQHHRSRKSGGLFRSRSEEVVSSRVQQSAGGGKPRRRFARVLHDEERWGEEYENPYVVRHLSKGYWERQQEEARKKLGESDHVPYSVNSEHTILKHSITKSASTSDSDMDMSGDKHPCFSNRVQVIEFIGKEKITKHIHHVHATRLVDSDDEVIYEEEPPPEVKNVKKLMRQESKDEFKIAKQAATLSSSDSEDEQLSNTKPHDSKDTRNGKAIQLKNDEPKPNNHDNNDKTDGSGSKIENIENLDDKQKSEPKSNVGDNGGCNEDDMDYTSSVTVIERKINTVTVKES